MGLTICIKNKCGKYPSFLAAAGSVREIVVVLPYSEPHRGGFQTHQYVIQLDMLERTQKQVVLHSNMFSQKNRASWYLKIDCVNSTYRKKWAAGKPNFSLGPLTKKGKGSMHHEKEVTSQVLRGQPQPKRYLSASACTIDRRKMYHADTVSNT